MHTMATLLVFFASLIFSPATLAGTGAPFPNAPKTPSPTSHLPETTSTLLADAMTFAEKLRELFAAYQPLRFELGSTGAPFPTTSKTPAPTSHYPETTSTLLADAMGIAEKLRELFANYKPLRFDLDTIENDKSHSQFDIDIEIAPYENSPILMEPQPIIPIDVP